MNAQAAHLTTEADRLAARIRALGRERGFQQVGIAGIDLAEDERRLQRWLAADMHGEMAYMARRSPGRARPQELLPGTVSVISVRMDYWPEADQTRAARLLGERGRAYVARYALGRDYHKLLRRRLAALGRDIEAVAGPIGHRVFVDSAPVMEKPLARDAGLGWIGKHSNLINRRAGSWFFLGEIYTDLPLKPDIPASDHCGSCRRCLDVCPTGAIVEPYVVDARRCISYLTIELRGSIPERYRPLIGNRIFGCDDCQLFCPWNKFAARSEEKDFAPRHGLDAPSLVTLFGWSEARWEENTRGSALRRAGYLGWLRNIAVALGNAPPSPDVVRALRSRADHPSELVREHVHWALRRQGAVADGADT